MSGIPNAIQYGLKKVEFRDFGLISELHLRVHRPIVVEIQKFTEPFQPVIDVLTASIRHLYLMASPSP